MTSKAKEILQYAIALSKLVKRCVHFAKINKIDNKIDTY